MAGEAVAVQSRHAKRRQLVIWILIPLSVVVGILLTMNTHESSQEASRTLFVSYFFFQASLVGIGGGFGFIGVLRRWLLVGLQMVELWITTGFEMDVQVILVGLMPVLAIGITCRMLSAWRHLVPVRIDETEVRSQNQALQFTVRNLIGATSVVACLISLARWGLQEDEELVFIAIWCAFYLAIALMAVWTLLGMGNALRRMAVVVMISVAIGFACEFFLGGRIMRLLIWTTALEATMLVAFLSVVRWAGWRLVPADSVVAVGEREGATADERAMQGSEMQSSEMQSIEGISAASLSDKVR